jgi:flagellar basal-body rod protein FlgB
LKRRTFQAGQGTADSSPPAHAGAFQAWHVPCKFFRPGTDAREEEAMDRLLGSPVDRLVEAMRFRVARQGALAANVANADTPGYRRVDVKFQDALQRAASEVRVTHARHLSSADASGVRVVRGPRGSRPDGNGVDRDREVLELSRNAGAFKDQAGILARVMHLRRIAATGETR